MNRPLPPGRHGFERLAPGDWWETEGIVVTEYHVAAFAGVAGDFFRIHMDDVAARELGFPRRVAHGLLGLSLLDGLKNRAAVQLEAVASLEWNWRFRAPILIGDRISGRIEVGDIRQTSKPDRAVVRLGLSLRNQDGVVVQDGTNSLMVARADDRDGS